MKLRIISYSEPVENTFRTIFLYNNTIYIRNFNVCINEAEKCFVNVYGLAGIKASSKEILNNPN